MNQVIVNALNNWISSLNPGTVFNITQAYRNVRLSLPTVPRDTISQYLSDFTGNYNFGNHFALNHISRCGRGTYRT